jgi:hypothetical protein
MTLAEANAFADLCERDLPQATRDDLLYSRSLLRQLATRRGLCRSERLLLRMVEADLDGKGDLFVVDLALQCARALEREVRRAREGAVAGADGDADVRP